MANDDDNGQCIVAIAPCCGRIVMATVDVLMERLETARKVRVMPAAGLSHRNAHQRTGPPGRMDLPLPGRPAHCRRAAGPQKEIATGVKSAIY